MTNVQAAAYIHAQAVAAQIEMEAMKAENKMREVIGENMAHVWEDFMKLQDKYTIQCNDVIQVFMNTTDAKP